MEPQNERHPHRARGPAQPALELKYTSSGTALLSLNLAVADDKRRDDEPTEWIRAAVWGDQAEQLEGRLKKGDLVYLEGRLRLRTWDKDGDTRAGLEVSAWKCEQLGAIGRRAPKPATGNGGGTPAPSTPDKPARRSPGGGAWATGRPAAAGGRGYLV